MKKVLSLLGVTLLLAGGISASAILVNKEEVYTPTFATYQNGDAATYYNGISDSETGNDLLKSLQALNKSKRQSTVGYGSMGTSASKQFKYTDYDPDTVQYDSNRQPYGTKVLSFYSGNSTSSFNREHVWPNSHGGNVVEDDIHMPRPTIPSENGSRGNSFYVEGMKDGSRGWDPAMEDFGQEDYRGDSARIIFYCVVADSRLSLIDDSYHYTTNANKDYLMGKLSDMIKWHLNYPVLQREKNRNEGAEYLQGNRNPFIDHPEYVCRIWGNTNSATRALCANDPYDTGAKEAPTAITLNKSSETLNVNGTVQLSVSSVTPADADNRVNWSTNNSIVVAVSSSGLVTAKAAGTAVITATSVKDANVKAVCNITVQSSGGGDTPTPTPSDVNVTNVTLDKTSADMIMGDTLQLTATVAPDNATNKNVRWSTSNSFIATVSDTGLVSAVSVGTVTITVTTLDGGKTATCNIVIIKKGSSGGGESGGTQASCGGNIIATSVILSSISLVGIVLLLIKKYKEKQ